MRKSVILSSLVIVLLNLTMFVDAQYSVTGIVKDVTDNSPVSYATAALLRTDSSVVTGVITNADGRFVIENVSEGNFLLQVSFIGYEKAYRMVNVPVHSDLGEIFLVESGQQLGEVTVTATRPLVEQRVDRYIVNVSNILRAGRDALGVLANTPGILVTSNGEITVMGKGVTIWIDGRPSNLSGEQLQALLTSMQGNEIERIEVITNPPARYDAEGSGGIINIRTTKGLQYGFNGSANLGYTQGHVGRENAGLSFNFRQPLFNLYGNYGFTRGSSWTNYETINKMETGEGMIEFMTDGTLRNGKPNNGNNQLRIGSDFFINEKNSIGILFNGYFRRNTEEKMAAATVIMPAFQGIGSSYSETNGNSNRDGQQVNLNYAGQFNKPGQQLMIDLDYARFYSKKSQNIRNGYFDTEYQPAGLPEQLRHHNPQNIRLMSAKTDYTQPVWEGVMVEFGGKISRSETDNNILYEEFIHYSGDWQTDIDRTRRFQYTETIGAFYTNIKQTVNAIWNFQAGLRGEYTKTTGDQKTTNVVNASSYFDLFPTFFIMYQPGQGYSYRFSYGRRLRRPGYYLLDPFELKIDAYSFSVGNPDLKPDYTHNFELSWSYKQLMTGLVYNYRDGQISSAPIVDKDRHGTMPINFGNRQNVTWMVNYRPSLTKFWSLNLYTEAAYIFNRAGDFENKGFGYMVSLNNRLTLTPKLSAEINGMYISRMRTGYFVNEPFGNLSLGLRQLLWDDRISVALTVNDMLNTQNTRVSADTDKIYQRIKEYNDTRWASVSISYNFGSNKVKGSRSRSVGNQDEVGRVNF